MSHRKNKLLGTLLLCIAVAAPFPVSGQQQKVDEKAQQQKVAEQKAQKRDIGNFSYSSQDRRDPFEPIYLLSMKKGKVKDAKAGYDLEELKFVGVMKTGAVKFAMMEDLQGRGMLFKKGDSLNKNLWVLDILEEKMVLGYKLRGDIRKIDIDIPRK
jgi:Tfp pilus assembly protein PilP